MNENAIDVDALLEALGDMTYSQAKEFAASLGVEIGPKQQEKQAAPQQTGPDAATLSALSAQFELEKKALRRGDVDALMGLKHKYRRMGLVIDGIGPQPQAAKAEPVQLTDEQQEALREEYYETMRRTPGTLKAQTKMQFRQRGLKLEGER
jgi:hypothetical protein